MCKWKEKLERIDEAINEAQAQLNSGILWTEDKVKLLNFRNKVLIPAFEVLSAQEDPYYGKFSFSFDRVWDWDNALKDSTISSLLSKAPDFNGASSFKPQGVISFKMRQVYNQNEAQMDVTRGIFLYYYTRINKSSKCTFVSWNNVGTFQTAYNAQESISDKVQTFASHIVHSTIDFPKLQ